MVFVRARFRLLSWMMRFSLEMAARATRSGRDSRGMCIRELLRRPHRLMNGAAAVSAVVILPLALGGPLPLRGGHAVGGVTAKPGLETRLGLPICHPDPNWHGFASAEDALRAAGTGDEPPTCAADPHEAIYSTGSGPAP